MAFVRKYLWKFVGTTVVLAGFAAFGFWWFDETEVSRLRRCRQLRQAENWNQLAKVSKEWTQRYPKTAEAWLYRAEAAQALGEFNAVADYLREIPADDERAIPARVELVNILFEKLNRPQEAVDVCHEILELDPRVTIARQRIIFFYALTLQRSALIREIREAISVHREPREAYVYLVGANWLVFGNQFDLNSKWLENSPDDENFHVARALHVIASNVKDNLERADEYSNIPNFEELLQRYPRNSEVLAIRLERQMSDGDSAGVENTLATLPESANNDARIWFARAWLHDIQGELTQAEADLRKSLEIDPYSWLAYHQMAALCRRTGRPDQVKHYEFLYKQCKQLREVIIKLRDAQSAPPILLQEIASFAEAVGDTQVAKTLRERLAE